MERSTCKDSRRDEHDATSTVVFDWGWCHSELLLVFNEPRLGGCQPPAEGGVRCVYGVFLDCNAINELNVG